MASRIRATARALRACALCIVLAACAGGDAPAPRAPAEPMHVDAAGRRYVVRTIPKAEAKAAGTGRARTRNGIELELVGADETSWHYKLYLSDERSPKAPPPPRAEPVPPPSVPALQTSRTLRFERVGGGLPTQGQWREGFDVADVDRDGHLDVVHGPARKGRPVPHVYRGDGRGGFAAWRTARFPDLPYDYGDARAADFDGDGHVDLALAVHLRGLLVLLGDGRGGFTAAGAGLGGPASEASFASRAIRAADFDGDGHADLAALGEGPRLGASAQADGTRAVLPGARGVAVWRGRGDGAFERHGADDPHGIYATSLALADFDGDGRLDVATGSSLLGRQDLVQLAGAEGALRPIAIAAVRPSSYVRAVAAADFDRDGRADLALAYVTLASGAWWSGLDVLLSGASQGAAAPADWLRVALAAREGRLDFRALATGDLDADGAPDLAAVDAAGSLVVFRGDGRGNFTVESEPPGAFADGCRGSHLTIADLDADGLGDLVASFGQEPQVAPSVCRSGGGLAAWRSVRHRPAL